MSRLVSSRDRARCPLVVFFSRNSGTCPSACILIFCAEPAFTAPRLLFQQWERSINYIYTNFSNFLSSRNVDDQLADMVDISSIFHFRGNAFYLSMSDDRCLVFIFKRCVWHSTESRIHSSIICRRTLLDISILTSCAGMPYHARREFFLF